MAFSKKDKGADQIIEVELEEPVTKTKINLDALDDALYYISKAGLQQQSKIVIASKLKASEEDALRKKLERSSLNMVKSKLA